MQNYHFFLDGIISCLQVSQHFWHNFLSVVLVTHGIKKINSPLTNADIPLSLEKNKNGKSHEKIVEKCWPSSGHIKLQIFTCRSEVKPCCYVIVSRTRLFAPLCLSSPKCINVYQQHIAGVTLSWTSIPSRDAILLLQVLHATETGLTLWQSEHP